MGCVGRDSHRAPLMNSRASRRKSLFKPGHYRLVCDRFSDAMKEGCGISAAFLGSFRDYEFTSVELSNPRPQSLRMSLF
jgi:hypothetical protein